MKKPICLVCFVLFSGFLFGQEQKLPPPAPIVMPKNHRCQKNDSNPLMSMQNSERRLSEVQIRGRLENRYAMTDADIEKVLKARKEILDVMGKYTSNSKCSKCRE